MNCDKKNELIWCHLCKKWIDALTVLVVEENIYCLHHESWDAAHLGFTWDWPELYG